MANPWRLIALLSFALSASAQFQQSPGAAIEQAARATAAEHTAPQTPAKTRDTEILTDTKDFQIHPYLQTVLPVVASRWFAAIRESVDSPGHKRGTVVAEFTIFRSGEIREAQIVSTSGQRDLDDAVLEGLKNASPLPALPQALPSDDLKLRLHFHYMGGREKSSWWNKQPLALPSDDLKVHVHFLYENR